jgi:hypothetical protein
MAVHGSLGLAKGCMIRAAAMVAEAPWPLLGLVLS